MKKTLIAALALTFALGWAPANSVDSEPATEERAIPERCQTEAIDRLVAAFDAHNTSTLSTEDQAFLQGSSKIKGDTPLCDIEIWNFLGRKVGSNLVGHGGAVMTEWDNATNIGTQVIVLRSVLASYAEIDAAVIEVYKEADKFYATIKEIGIVANEERGDGPDVIVELTLKDEEIADPSGSEALEKQRDQILGILKYAKGDHHGGEPWETYGGETLIAYRDKVLALQAAIKAANTRHSMGMTFVETTVDTADGIQRPFFTVATKALAFDPEDDGSSVNIVSPNGRNVADQVQGDMAKIDWMQLQAVGRHTWNVIHVLDYLDAKFPDGKGVWEQTRHNSILAAQNTELREGGSGGAEERFARGVLAQYKARMQGLTDQQLFDGAGVRPSGDLNSDQQNAVNAIRAQHQEADVARFSDGWYIVQPDGSKKKIEVPSLSGQSQEDVDASITSTAEGIANSLIAGDDLKAKLTALGFAIAGPEEEDEPDAPIVVADLDPAQQKELDKLAKCDSPGDLFRSREQRIRDERIATALGRKGANSEKRAEIQEGLSSCIAASSSQLGSDKAALAAKEYDPSLSANALTAAKTADAQAADQRHVQRVDGPLPNGCWAVANKALGDLPETSEDDKIVVDAAYEADGILHQEFTRNVLKKIDALKASYLSTGERGRLVGLSGATGWQTQFILKKRDDDKTYIDEYFDAKRQPGPVADCVARLGFKRQSKDDLAGNIDGINDKPDWKDITVGNVDRYCDVCTLDGNNNRCGGDKGAGTLVHFIKSKEGGSAGTGDAPNGGLNEEEAQQRRDSIRRRLPQQNVTVGSEG